LTIARSTCAYAALVVARRLTARKKKILPGNDGETDRFIRLTPWFY
jgi:hypothetical protein